MKYSRRHFLKAAGSGAVVLTTVGGYRSVAGIGGPGPDVCRVFAAPMTVEIGTFIINGATYQAEYEARTTLWEVIAMKLAMTGERTGAATGRAVEPAAS